MIRLQATVKKTQLLCGFLFEGSGAVPGLNSKAAQSIKDNAGRLGELTVTQSTGPAERIMVAGVGKKSVLDNDTFRHVAGKIAIKARDLKLGDVAIILPGSDQASIASQIVQGYKMALYSFDQFKSEKKDTAPRLAIICNKSPEVTRAVMSSEIISDGAIFVKGVANMPPNMCSPATLAGIAKSLKVKCKILSQPELKKRGFGGITAVGQGSQNKPRLIVLEYNNAPKKRPLVLVGKAVTFDTGGISLKPGEKMDEMKFDKCGGCTVLGIIKTASELRLPVNLVGLVPSVENMPGGGSYRPGDIIKLYSGKTAEILNTDAEGRLILADALAYGEQTYSPRAIIDFATLTGACIVALGTNVAGMVSNDPKLVADISGASKRTTERVWELPLDQDYMDMIKSDVADMKNMGIGRAAGTITAAAFLKNAIKKTPWVHLDIAGVAWTQAATKKRSYNPKGATGFGLRLVIDYLQNS